MYSRRLLRNIRTRWTNFKVRHPATVRYAKYVSWLSGVAVLVGSAVSVPVELYRAFHTLNHTDTEIMSRIDNVTKELGRLQEKCQSKFEEYPDQTIYDLYYKPLKRDSRGTYHLGMEDIPRSEENPDRMDPLFQEMSGLPEILKNITTKATTRTTTASKLIDMNRTSHLEKEHTSEDDTSNATGNPVPACHLEKGFTWHNLWENKRLSPRKIGWIMLAMAGVIILLIYACFVLLVRKCCVFFGWRFPPRTTIIPVNSR